MSILSKQSKKVFEWTQNDGKDKYALFVGEDIMGRQTCLVQIWDEDAKDWDFDCNSHTNIIFKLWKIADLVDKYVWPKGLDHMGDNLAIAPNCGIMQIKDVRELLKALKNIGLGKGAGY